MSPELHVFGLTVVFFAVAYLTVYPRLEKKTLKRIMRVDLVLLAILVGIAGSVYYNAGVSFTLVFFETWWWIYTLVIAVIVETPLFLWFAKVWDIDLTNIDD